MSCKCCSTSNDFKNIKSCPICNSKSEKVENKTVFSLLKKESQLLLDNQEFNYCNNQNCDLVYFSEKQSFYKKDLNVNINDKVCYCFDISKIEIEKDGKGKVLDKIKANMNDIGCSCDTKNPSGKCCMSQIETEY